MGFLRRRIGSALDRRFQAVGGQVESVDRHVDALAAELSSLRGETADGVARLERAVATLAAEVHDARDVNAAALRTLVRGDAANRRRLAEVRLEPSYAAVFDDPRPLVSVVIPTHDRADLLVKRSLPSVLAQSYDRLEVIVVGHAAGPEMRAAVESLDDERVRYTGIDDRIPEQDPRRRWLIASVAPRNAGHAQAQGSWLVDFDDDDELRPNAIECGLAFAREHRLEVSYGGFECRRPNGDIETVACFPPELGRFAWQGALVHAGLRFFERDLAAAGFDTPNDWFKVEAMLRAGVRFGMHDQIVCDYYPSMRGVV